MQDKECGACFPSVVEEIVSDFFVWPTKAASQLPIVWCFVDELQWIRQNTFQEELLAVGVPLKDVSFILLNDYQKLSN